MLPKFTGKPLELGKMSWVDLPKDWEHGRVKFICACLTQVLEAGVTRVGVMSMFIARQIQPIKLRVHPMYEYVNHNDVTQESANSLPGWEVRS